MNEFDRFVKHNLNPKAYLRYGDDFIIIETNFQKLNFLRVQAVDFLQKSLKLRLNTKNDRIFKANHGLKFLGVVLFPNGRILNKRNRWRVKRRLNQQNAGSYFGLIQKHGNPKMMKQLSWLLLQQSL